MTYKEMMMRMHPDLVSSVIPGGVCGCPGSFFDDAPVAENCCNIPNDRWCTACWNREIPNAEPDTAQEAPQTGKNKLRVVLDPGAIMPTRAHKEDAGLDLYSREDIMILERGNHKFDTGVHIAIPVGYVGDIKSRSGMMVNENIITDGTIDAGYTGSICVKLFNLGDRPVRIRPGQKIAQLVIKQIITPEPVQVDSLEETERGTGGFGSTGKF